MSGSNLTRSLKRALRASLFLVLAPFASLARVAQGHRPLVLAFHDPDPTAFERHVEALRRRYTLVTLADVLDAIASGDVAALPLRPLAITLDDGHASNRELLPVCKRLGVRPTVFVCTRAGTDGFWWSGIPALEQRRLKGVPDAERRAYVLAHGPADAPLRGLSEDDLRAMADVFDLQPHTRTHPVLPRCDDAAAKDEIAGSKLDLEHALGRACDAFAYPNGDLGDRDVAIVRAAGFRAAFTTRPGLVGAGTDPLRLPRILVRDDAPARELLVRASGLPGAIQRLVPKRLWSALQVR